MRTLTLPQAGKAPSSATVLRWRAKVGDTLAKDQILVEVETDEGLIEIESVVAGKLTQILAPAGRTVPVGGPLAIVDGDSAPEKSSAQHRPASSSAVSPAPAKPTPMNPPAAPAIPAGKVIPILMPKAGQSMEEGTIVKWNVKPGARIKKGDIIFEIETDKATMEVEAVDEGRLARILIGEGGICPVQQPVGYLAETDADVDSFIAAQGGASAAPAGAPVSQSAAADRQSATQEPAARSAPAATTDSGRVKASPAARKVAAQRGIELAQVGQGSGPGGRILSTDVPASAPAIRPAASAASAAPAPAGAPVSSPDLPPGVVRKRMSNMRKAIARNLTLSKTTIPHWYISARIDAAPLIAFYKGQKARYPVSLNDVIVMACARVIMEFPAFRSRVDGDTLLEFPGANIGVAVGMDEGLVVPVVMNAEKFSLERLGEETKRLANQARSGKIENMGLGVFTISNLGMFDVDEFTAIVNPPEAAILAVSTVREDVIVKDGAIRAGQTMNITLSSDHRLIDGTLGAQFMAKLKSLLENPVQLIA